MTVKYYIKNSMLNEVGNAPLPVKILIVLF